MVAIVFPLAVVVRTLRQIARQVPILEREDIELIRIGDEPAPETALTSRAPLRSIT
jgi:hypothetical protein